jgi:hypothetical protein
MLRAFIEIRLRPGWRLGEDQRSVRRDSPALRVPLALLPGAVLSPALPLPPLPDGHTPWPAEAELARFVHLRLPEGGALDDALTLARLWPFVERAQACTDGDGDAGPGPTGGASGGGFDGFFGGPFNGPMPGPGSPLN